MLPVKSNLLPTVSKFFEDDWNNIFDWTNRNLPETTFTFPPVNIEENDEMFSIHLAAPGMEKEDFKIELKDKTLSIQVQIQKQEQKESNNFTRVEYNYSNFRRTFNLDNSYVDFLKIEAKYHNGILMIQIPKKEEAKTKPPMQISIK